MNRATLPTTRSFQSWKISPRQSSGSLHVSNAVQDFRYRDQRNAEHRAEKLWGDLWDKTFVRTAVYRFEIRPQKWQQWRQFTVGGISRHCWSLSFPKSCWTDHCRGIFECGGLTGSRFAACPRGSKPRDTFSFMIHDFMLEKKYFKGSATMLVGELKMQFGVEIPSNKIFYVATNAIQNRFSASALLFDHHHAAVNTTIDSCRKCNSVLKFHPIRLRKILFSTA